MKQRGDEAFDTKAGTLVGSPLFLCKKPPFFGKQPRKAFSLMELLVCLLLCSVLAGAILVTFLPP
ncbi:MAG: prepilin-type N-terminal cleavage/methylation domain-containing protein [Thermovirgaceae bacterium]